MFAFILESLTSLLLAGVLVYVVFTWARIKNRERLQQILLAIIFSVTAVSLDVVAMQLGSYSAHLDFAAGPLVFAGYLGGPVGAVIAGLCTALFRFLMVGPPSNTDVFMNITMPALGLVVSYLIPLPDWPKVRKSAIVALISGCVLLHFPPYFLPTLVDQTQDTVANGFWTMLGFAIISCLSISITWQTLKYALRYADNTNQTADLANRLDLVMRASGVGMFVYKVGETALYYDAGMIAMLGLNRKPGMIQQSEWRPLVHPDDMNRVREEMNTSWARGQYMGNTDYRAFRPDGTIQYIRLSWLAELDANGGVNRITGINSDLTDIREARQKERDSRNRIASVAEKLPGVIIEYDVTEWENPQLLYISPKCVEIWGYTDAELYDNPVLLAQMHDPKDLTTFLKASRKSCETGEPLSWRYMIKARDGQTRWLDHHGGSSTEDGRLYVKAIVLDVTREVELQRRMEEEREIARRAQKNESIGQLTGGVAHDFNNLLAVILGNLELLREDEDPVAQKEMIDAAITATLRGADLTKNMLAFARQAPLNPVRLDLNNVVREAKNWTARALPESVVVETSLLAGLWPIKADRSSLESALLNLTLNARDAMNGHGSLTIETANVRIDNAYVVDRKEDLAPGRYVMLAVSDTGPGIPDDVIGSIFEPFFTTKAPGLGSGLGLSMTEGFMKQSNGTVQVYTERGQGTTFKLYFPATTAETDQPALTLPPKSQAAGNGKTLLLAEDEDAVRVTMVLILEREGYQVTATASGDEAFATFQANPTFDLLLTDIVMPGTLQGTGLAKALRERWPDLPVVFMSGYASEATVHGNGLRPEDIRLMKPVQRTDLLAAVAKAASMAKGKR